MIDINDLRKRPDYYKGGTQAKGYNPDVVDEVLRFDRERRDLLLQVEKLRAQRNKLTKNDIEKGRQLKAKLQNVEPQLARAQASVSELLLRIPNPPLLDVKRGKNEEENEIIKKWGTIRKFTFSPKDHVVLGEALDIIDIKRASKVSGTRFAYLKGYGALLEFALSRFVMDLLVKEGFIPVIPPVLISKNAMGGMGYMEHGGSDDMYVLDKDNLVLVGTSEQSIGPMHEDEIFDIKDLPIRYAGYSTCFRRESGSYGKDTKGILRVHQFNKIEMFSFTLPEKSDKEHEFLLKLEEKIFQLLEIPYQVVKMCSGDLGAPAGSKYDIEVWMPGQNRYREVTSTSNCTDFQSRRLNIKYREKGVLKFVHMLNGTGVSMNRPIIAILENFQREDGSVEIPKVLQKYMGKRIITSSKKGK